MDKRIAESQRLQADVAEFLSKGGCIQQLDESDSFDSDGCIHQRARRKITNLKNRRKHRAKAVK